MVRSVTSLNRRLDLAASERELQRVAASVVAEDEFGRLETVAGFDLAFTERRAVGAVVVVDVETLETVEERTCVLPISAPYIPGYLYLRELPAIRKLYSRLARRPDLLMIDGHGILHPRRAGIACHAGLALKRPAIGVAKSLLVGRVESETLAPGEWSPIKVDGAVLGAALRTTARAARPVYVSTGHRVSLKTAVSLVKRLSINRVPEPTRRADILAASAKREILERS